MLLRSTEDESHTDVTRQIVLLGNNRIVFSSKILLTPKSCICMQLNRTQSAVHNQLFSCAISPCPVSCAQSIPCTVMWCSIGTIPQDELCIDVSRKILLPGRTKIIFRSKALLMPEVLICVP